MAYTGTWVPLAGRTVWPRERSYITRFDCNPATADSAGCLFRQTQYKTLEEDPATVVIFQMSFVKILRQFYITVSLLAAPELFHKSPCSGQRVKLFRSDYSSSFVNLLHLSIFRKLLGFPGVAFKQKCCFNVFPSVMPLFLLLPYIKKILSLYEYFTNISYHQLSPALLVIPGISTVREFSVL